MVNEYFDERPPSAYHKKSKLTQKSFDTKKYKICLECLVPVLKTDFAIINKERTARRRTCKKCIYETYTKPKRQDPYIAECLRATNEKWRKNNAEKEKQRLREYHVKVKEKRAARYQENKEQIRAEAKEYYQRNREWIIAKKRAERIQRKQEAESRRSAGDVTSDIAPAEC